MPSHLGATQDALKFIYWVLGRNNAPILGSVEDVGKVLLALGFSDCWEGTYHQSRGHGDTSVVIQLSRNSWEDNLPEVTIRLSYRDTAVQARIRFNGSAKSKMGDIIDSENLRDIEGLGSLRTCRAAEHLQRYFLRTRTCQTKPNPQAAHAA